MDIGVDESFRHVLNINKLNDFESLWNLKGELVELGNVKEKSGHSHVMRAYLESETGPLCVYMKRQSNYSTTLSRLLGRSRSICRREYENIAAWEAMGLPALKAVYCAEVQNPLRGILITVALEGYQPLDDYLPSATAQGRRAMLQATAKLIRCIHDAGWVHRCFFPKHVFVSPNNTAKPAQMIDLEKARKAWFGVRDYTRDMASFERRMVWQDEAERKMFFDSYFGGAETTLYRRLFMHLIGKRMRSVSYVNRCSKRD
ncbi:MAG: lipopolysaccharide kinase InaA family protein [Gammaproteobacteria bacterium]